MSAVDGGGEGATWISAVLEVEARLVYCLPGRARHVDPTYAAGDDRVGLADGFPLLVMRMVAELIGTALLLTAIGGSGIMGERLAGGNVAIALLANTLATGAALVTLILDVGPISGADLNPAVTFADGAQRGISWRRAAGYVGAQIAGALVGVAVAHLMFEQQRSLRLNEFAAALRWCQ